MVPYGSYIIYGHGTHGTAFKGIIPYSKDSVRYIQIIKIGLQCFAIAVCKDTVTYLGEVKEEELIYSDSSTGKFSTDSFKAILEKYKKDKPED